MTQPISRRAALGQLTATVVAMISGTAIAQTKVRITVYKDASCGCCKEWVKHMVANGFIAEVTDTDMQPIKALHKIPARLESCHTTLVGGYVVEGHVPASDVRKLLASKRKDIVGLTLPGMPASAPGMDMIPFRPYEVLTFDQQGRTTVFAKHDRA